jgi:hypothetical protein
VVTSPCAKPFSLWRAGIKPRPEDEGKLKRNSQPLRPSLAHDAGCWQVGCRHVDIGWQYHDEQSYQSPGCSVARLWEEKAYASENLCCAADVKDGKVRRQPGRNNFEVDGGMKEVKAAGDDEENGEENAANHAGSLPSCYMSRLFSFLRLAKKRAAGMTPAARRRVIGPGYLDTTASR